MPPVKRRTPSTRVDSLGAALYCSLPAHDRHNVSPYPSNRMPHGGSVNLSPIRAANHCQDRYRDEFYMPTMNTFFTPATTGTNTVVSPTSSTPRSTPGASTPSTLPATANSPPATSNSTTSSNNTPTKKKQTASEKSWDATYSRLVEYQSNNGDCLVPWRYESDPQLGNWVKEQRKKKKNNTLSPSRRERLEKIGFVWRVQQNHRVEAWEDVFARLVHYKQQHGNTMVPSNYKQDPKLGRWVSMQRFRQESLSPERKELLESIGFL